MGVSFQDYYEILGVKRDATEKEIKTAYRKAARKWHPDLHEGKDKEVAEGKIKEINEAYEVLKDKDKRAKYDQLGSNWQNGQEFYPPPNMDGFEFFTNGRPGQGFGSGAGGGFSDFFDILFGQGGQGFTQQGRGGRRPRGHEQGSDHESELEISLEEAYKGAEKNLQFAGGGKALTVKIPAGVHDGSRIRLKGQGGEGYGGGPRGDLYLRVHIRPHPQFKVRGNDILTDVMLRPDQAVLGDQVAVPTLDGKVKVTIPKGTGNGKSLRLKGKGLPEGKVRGDQYVKIVIDIPSQLSAEEEALYQKLAELRKI